SSVPYIVQRPAPPVLYTLSLHDALPISPMPRALRYSSSCKLMWAARTSSLAFPAISLSTRGTTPPSMICLAIWRKHLGATCPSRSEEHTSELQSRFDLVCRLLLEKKT